jgi:hypothetical protein
MLHFSWLFKKIYNHIDILSFLLFFYLLYWDINSGLQTWATNPAKIFPRVSHGQRSCYFCFRHIWDYRCEPSCLACYLRKGLTNFLTRLALNLDLIVFICQGEFLTLMTIFYFFRYFYSFIHMIIF